MIMNMFFCQLSIAAEEKEFCMNEDFSGDFTEIKNYPNLLQGGTITNNNNYRDEYRQKQTFKIEDDSVKQNYMSTTLLEAVSGKWAGVYHTVPKSSEGRYEVTEFDFKLNNKDAGTQVYFQLDANASYTIVTRIVFYENRFVSMVRLNGGDKRLPEIYYADYGIEPDFFNTSGWHNVKLLLDKERSVYDIFIDGVIVGTDIPTYDDISEKDYSTKRFMISANGNVGAQIGYDDIKLCSASQAEVNELIKAGYDKLFRNEEIYFSPFVLPYAGWCGFGPSNGEAKISYTTDKSENVVVTNTHYVNDKAGSSKIEFTGIPQNELDEDLPFTITVKNSFEGTDGTTTEEYSYNDLKLAFLSDEKRVQRSLESVDYINLTNDDKNELLHNLYLPSSNEKFGTTYSWSSNNTDALTNDGVITRLDADAHVTFTLTATYEGNNGTITDTKDFYFIIPASAILLMDADSEQIGNELPDLGSIVEDFILPSVGSVNGSSIEWISDDEAIVINGNIAQISRPRHIDDGGRGNVTVTLTARLTYGTETKDYEFYATVLCMPSDMSYVKTAYDKLTFASISTENQYGVTTNLALKNNLGNSVTCTWISSDDTVIKEDGTVIQPQIGSGNVTVTLRAVITKGVESLEKEFEVTVIAFENEEELLEKAKNMLAFSVISDDEIGAVSSDLRLPKQWLYNTTIEWENDNSSAVAFLDNDDTILCKVVRAKNPAPCTLKATISYNNLTVEKSFYINISPQDRTSTIMQATNSNSKIGSTPTMSAGIGKCKLENPGTVTYEVIADPLNPSNNVVKFVRIAGAGQQGPTFTYVLQNENDSFNSSEAILKIKLLIPEENTRQITISALGRSGIGNLTSLNIVGNEIPFLEYQIDGVNKKFTSKGSNYIVPTGKWIDIEFVADTNKKMYHIWLDGVCITKDGFIYDYNDEPYSTADGFPFLYAETKEDGRVYGLRVSQWGRLMDIDTPVYIDDLLITKKFEYSSSLETAIENFAVSFLGQNDINSIYKDLVIPQLGVSGINAEYISGDTNIVTNDGKVNIGTEPQEVDFLVKFIDLDGNTYLRTFNLKLVDIYDDAYIRQKSDLEVAQEDLDNIILDLKSKYNFININSNIALESTSKSTLSSINYSSSDTNVLSNSGVIKKGETDKKVTLTVSVTCGESTVSESIEVTVKAQPAQSNNSEKEEIKVVTGVTGGGAKYSFESEKPIIQTPPSDENTPISNGFKDVDKQHWAYKEIMYLKESGISNGDQNNNFNPQKNITREEAIKMIVVFSGEQIVEEDISREDVDINSWYYPYIKTAIHKGIASGYSQQLFGIGDNMTREDFFVTIANLIAKTTDINYSDADKFSDDNEISEYAKKAIYFLKNNNIVTGYEGKVNPKNYISRAEVAAIIYRLSGK